MFGGPFAAADDDAAVGEGSLPILETLAGGAVELIPRRVVARDHRHHGAAVFGPCVGPLVDHACDRVGLGGVDRDLLGFVVEVGVRVAVVQCFERFAFSGVVLAKHLA